MLYAGGYEAVIESAPIANGGYAAVVEDPDSDTR